MLINQSGFRTQAIRDQVQDCKSLDKFEQEILPILHSQQEAWKAKSAQLLADYPGSASAFAQSIGITRQGVSKWKTKGTVPSREMMLRVGLACGYDIQGINDLLCRYGRYSGLYSKSLEDCACIFVSGKYQDAAERLEKFSYIIETFKQYATDSYDQNIPDVDTKIFDQQLAQVENEDELSQFITKNAAVFSTAYRKLYAQIQADCQDAFCFQPEMFRKLQQERRIDTSFYQTLYQFAASQGWSSTQTKIIYDILSGRRWYPTRNRLLITGIYLDYNTGDMDDILELAHMEPLCSKNALEAVLIYIFSTCDRKMAEDDIRDRDKYSEYENTADLLEYFVKKGLLELPNEFEEDLVDDEC